jgi:hypothetical protein
MNRALMIAVLALACTSAIANPKGNVYGFVKAAIVPQPDCPVALGRVGVQDAASQNKTWAAWMGSVGGPGSHAANERVRYDVEVQTKKAGITAFEVEWVALNAMDEPQSHRLMSFAWPKPLSEHATKHESQEAERMDGDVSKFSVRVTRIRFADGSDWKAAAAEPPAPPSPPPAN